MKSDAVCRLVWEDATKTTVVLTTGQCAPRIRIYHAKLHPLRYPLDALYITLKKPVISKLLYCKKRLHVRFNILTGKRLLSDIKN